MERLQDKLKELRKQRDWSQEDLDREVGVSLATVQRWEARGDKPCRLARRERTRLFQEAGLDGEQD